MQAGAIETRGEIHPTQACCIYIQSTKLNAYTYSFA